MKQSMPIPNVLSIAGSDPSGGAGIQADLKTFSALGVYGASVITALTAQNTVGVQGIHALPPEMLAQQIESVVSDIGVDAVKIGMLHDPAVVKVVAEAVRRHRFAHVVLDPVMVANSGDRLIEEETVAVLVRELFPLATVITPNLDEAAWLLGHPITSNDQLQSAADGLRALGARAALVKGGHLSGPVVADLLVTPERSWRWEDTRIATTHTHGTGCTLSTAIACHLALGLSLPEAVEAARRYVRQAMQSGAEMQLGHGHGPLDHGFAPQVTVRRPLD